MLFETIMIVGVGIGLAYGLDKFMGSGLFKLKETQKDNLIISTEDQNRKLKNEQNLGQVATIQKFKNKKYYGAHKTKVFHESRTLCKPHPVITNFVNKLYMEKKK